MKVLILGAGGMAGHVVALYLKEAGLDVDTLSAKNAFDDTTFLVDVKDEEKLKSILNTGNYDAVVNCIALLVEQSEAKKDLAVYLNSYLPKFLESHYKNSKTRVIHISTNGVFSTKNPPYTEDSAYDAENFYGRSKALGEIINNKDLSFRLSIVGPSMQENGTGLFNWFWHQTGEITGYTKAIWNGVTTLELAKAIKASIEQNLTGVYHLVPKEDISKFDLLQLFKQTFGKQDLTINPVEGSASDQTLTNTRTDFNYEVPGYKTMIADMKTWIETHPEIYKHYANKD